VEHDRRLDRDDGGVGAAGDRATISSRAETTPTRLCRQHRKARRGRHAVTVNAPPTATLTVNPPRSRRELRDAVVELAKHIAPSIISEPSPPRFADNHTGRNHDIRDDGDKCGRNGQANASITVNPVLPLPGASLKFNGSNSRARLSCRPDGVHRRGLGQEDDGYGR
jgi:hypothetical protein